jgi:hypothetical protein
MTHVQPTSPGPKTPTSNPSNIARKRAITAKCWPTGRAPKIRVNNLGRGREAKSEHVHGGMTHYNEGTYAKRPDPRGMMVGHSCREKAVYAIMPFAKLLHLEVKPDFWLQIRIRLRGLLL